jgi:hypothetical protein
VAVTIANIEARMTAAVAAMDAGNYKQARIDALAAKAMLSVVPNGTAQGFGTAWDRTAIDEFIEQMKALEDEAGVGLPAAGPYFRVPVVYKRVEGDA